jgi:hypothetical protein
LYTWIVSDAAHEHVPTIGFNVVTPTATPVIVSVGADPDTVAIVPSPVENVTDDANSGGYTWAVTVTVLPTATETGDGSNTISTTVTWKLVVPLPDQVLLQVESL